MDTGFLIAGALVVILVGISKSGFSGGVGMIAVPVLSLFVSPQTAAAIMLPILCVIDVSNMFKYWKHWVRRIVYLLIPGAMIGILIGAASFSQINPSWLKIGLGLLALWFVFRTLKADDKTAGTKPAGFVAAIFYGALSGLTSFVAHAGGPPVKGFLLSQRLEKTPFVATNSILFLVINQIKLFPYFFLGQFTSENLTISLTLLPFAGIGIVIGYQLHKLISQQLFTKVACALLFLAGVKLIWDGCVGLVV